MSTKTAFYLSDDVVEISTIDYAQEKGPFWLVWCDDSPVSPDCPLPLGHALHAFERAAREAAENGDGEVVELRQCDAETLEWAGITVPGDDEDGDA